MTTHGMDEAEQSAVEPGVVADRQQPPPERNEVLQWMDRLATVAIRTLRFDRRRLEKARRLHGIPDADWYRLLAANGLIRSAEIHEHLDELRMRENRRKVKNAQRHRCPAARP